MESQALPEWIRLLPLGWVELVDGREPLEVDQGALKTMVAAFQGRGNDLVIDYEHQSLKGERAPAAGWIKDLEAREDGLWGKVEWTPKAQEYLRHKEYRYFSPVLHLDPQTRRPLALTQVALTNVPAIRCLSPLVAKAEEEAGEREEGGPREVEGEALEARRQKYGIGIKEGGQAVPPAEWAQVPEEEWGDPVNWRYPCHTPENARAAWAYWHQEGNRADYTPEEQGIITDRLRRLAQAQGVDLGEDQVDLKELAREVGAALGLAPGAGPAEVLAGLESLKREVQEAWALKERLGELTLRLAAWEVKEQVEVALKEGKVTPAQRGWAEDYARRDLEGFKAFASRAPRVVPVGEPLKFREDSQSRLTEVEEGIWRALGVTGKRGKLALGPDK